MEEITVTVNGRSVTMDVDERTLLLELLRDGCDLTGVHNGCLEARCGCCAVLIDGAPVKSCNVLALQANGRSIVTVEGLADGGDRQVAGVVAVESMTPLQRAFHEHGAVQCGFCTPGMLMVLAEYLREVPDPSADGVRQAIRGNLCRCTGYQKIVDAALSAAAEIRARGGAEVAV